VILLPCLVLEEVDKTIARITAIRMSKMRTPPNVPPMMKTSVIESRPDSMPSVKQNSIVIKNPKFQR
jgi:hypothetical protein